MAANVYNPVSDVGVDQYISIAASTNVVLTSALALGVGSGAGAKGDFFQTILVIPSSTSPTALQIKDGSNSAITVFNGGAASLTNLAPFPIPLGFTSVQGAWSVITPTGCAVLVRGKFT